MQVTSDAHQKPPATTRGILIWLAIFTVLVAFAWTMLIVVTIGMFLLT